MVKDRKIKKLILEIIDRLKKGYEPDKIILYGSYAYGQPTRDSDLDLFIIKKTDKRRIDRFVEVKRMIYDPKRHISVSPIIYTPKEIEERIAIGDDFIREVLAQGEIIYAR